MMKLKNEKKYQMDYNECKALVKWSSTLDHELMKKIREHPNNIADIHLYFSILKFMHQASFQLILHIFEQDGIDEEKLRSEKNSKKPHRNVSINSKNFNK